MEDGISVKSGEFGIDKIQHSLQENQSFGAQIWLVLAIWVGIMLNIFGQGAPLRITLQPISQAANLGSNVTFRVTATGASPLIYQWYFNDVALNGATNSSLAIANLSSEKEGLYSAVVSNSAGSTTSQVARLRLVTGFTKVVSDPIALANQSFGSSWGDFNNDGYLDQVVAGTTNRLYLNNKDGTFHDMSSSNSIPGKVEGQGSGIWGDTDNDGDMDLLISHSRAASYFYENKGDGTFISRTNVAIVNSRGAQGRAWADYDRDGFIDLALGAGNVSDYDFLYHNNADGSFTRITNSALRRVPDWHTGCAWGDYNNDLWPDLFIGSDGGAPLFLSNQGNGQFVRLTNAVTRSTRNGWAPAWGDYNNDGWLDLFVGSNRQPNNLFQNNGDGTFTRITNSILANDVVSGSWDCAWGDFDNDGWLDLYVLNSAVAGQSKDFLYYNNGDGTFSKVTTGRIVTDETDGSGAGCAWGDYDRDGFLDLFTANYQQRNVLFRNNGNSNAWLVVQCKGRISNRSSIGAKVRVRASIRGKEFWQLREISGGHGYASQNALEAQFGLGDATKADLVRIEWPSGVVQEIRDVRANQILIIHESPKMEIIAEKQGEVRILFRGGKNFIYDIESSTDLLRWSQRFTVTNTAGSMVLKDNLPILGARFFRASERR